MFDMFSPHDEHAQIKESPASNRRFFYLKLPQLKKKICNDTHITDLKEQTNKYWVSSLLD